jgi:hypothetical protein
MMSYRSIEIGALVGETLTRIDGLNKGSDSVTFETASGKRFQMWHRQDCCESVDIEDVCGDVADLIGSPIVRAESPSSVDGCDGKALSSYEESFTWTFYILGTAKGTVTIRWYGSSNGYYSECVDFEGTTGEEN